VESELVRELVGLGAVLYCKVGSCDNPAQKTILTVSASKRSLPQTLLVSPSLEHASGLYQSRMITSLDSQ